MNTANTPIHDLIAPCGMNCGLCASYPALKNEVKAKGAKMPYCAGCRPRNKNCVPEETLLQTARRGSDFLFRV